MTGRISEVSLSESGPFFCKVRLMTINKMGSHKRKLFIKGQNGCILSKLLLVHEDFDCLFILDISCLVLVIPLLCVGKTAIKLYCRYGSYLLPCVESCNDLG